MGFIILYTRSLPLSLSFLFNLKSKYLGCLNLISSWKKGYLLQKLDNCKWFLMDPHLKYICLLNWKDLIFISTIVLNSTNLDNKNSRNLATFVFLGSHNSNRNRGAPKQQSLIPLESMFQTTIFDSTKVVYIRLASKSHVDGNTM